MEIFLNEKSVIVKKGYSAFKVRDSVKADADVVILNGFMIKEDTLLKEKDKLILIKRGEIPNKDELENLLVSRHTPGLHEKVKNAVVGIAGLGGLGSNAAVSLARLGIGKLILVDYDVVEPSNLNRQQYFIKHIGMLKTQALREIIYEINPYVEVKTIDIYLDKQNIMEYFKEAQIIIEAFDNPKCKAELTNTILTQCKDKFLVAASGMAGYFSNNTIKTRKITNRFYLVGDNISEAKPGCGLMAPRVSIAANHQANMALRLILGEEDI